jgi:uncharacterized iron-regulated membrane protein
MTERHTKSQDGNAVRPKNWLLAKFRKWHTWGGIIAGLFILLVAMSGIVLNYKNPIFRTLRLEEKRLEAKSPQKRERSGPKPELSTSAGIAALPITLDRAFELARAQWGDARLERIELKDESGELIYKLKQKNGEELWVNAISGATFLKGKYEKLVKAESGTMPTPQTDWGKIILDLHTGKIGGEFGKAVMSVAALMLLFLTGSGVYMWLKPLLTRRANAKQRATLPGNIQPPRIALTAVSE